MEKNGSKQEGYATVESSIVVPVIIILITMFLVVFIGMFKYTYGVIDIHEQNLQMEESDGFEVAFNLFGFPITKSYDLPDKEMSIQTLQRLFELLITLFDDYNERLKFYEDEL